MSFQDRSYYRDPPQYRAGGGDIAQKALAFFNWSFSIGKYFGIRVRVHITFVLLLIGQLLIDHDPAWTLRWAGILFFSVLLHEFGHCIGCRMMRGTANEILMWPLGGLAFCAPPRRPWPEFVTVACGPLVNALLATASFATLLALYGTDSPVTLNPFHPYHFQYWNYSETSRLLADIFAVNYGLLLFNVLLVFYPFDGGRMVQIALWTRLGYARSMKIATTLGMAGAIAAAIFALGVNNSLLLAVCVFGFMTCYQQSRYLRQAGEYEMSCDARDESSYEARPGLMQRWRNARSLKAANRAATSRREQQELVDQILAKVHQHGLASLSEKEKAVLQRASQM